MCNDVFDELNERREDVRQRFGFLIDGSAHADVDAFLREHLLQPKSLSEFCDKIAYYHAVVAELERVETLHYCSLVELDLSPTVEILKISVRACADRIVQALADEHFAEAARVCDEFGVIERALQAEPENTEQLIEAALFVKHLHTERMAQLERSIADTYERMMYLAEVYAFGSEQLLLNALVVTWSDKLAPSIEASDGILFRARTQQEEQLATQKEALLVDIGKLDRSVNEFKDFERVTDVRSSAVQK